MVTEERMTVEERYKYLRLMHQRYDRARRGERSRLLDEAVAVTQLGRKYLSHLLNKDGPIRKRRRRARGYHYGTGAAQVVRIVAEALDWICAERLQPTLARTAQHLASFGELTLDDAVLAQLEQMSISTLYRMLRRIRQDEPRLPQRRGRAGPTGPASTIPATRLEWQISEPGHFELDTVHHGGPHPTGDYVCTLQWIDVATGWSERVAVLGRSSQEMIAAFEVVISRCPFPIREIHPDNGSEFLNEPLLSFFCGKVTGVKLTRSRPFHKNDNRFVEQKNYTLVRAYLGRDRLDSRAQCVLLNRIYEDMWVYYNLFQPVLHQREKTVERAEDGSLRIHRQHDVAQTPFERLLATGVLSDLARDDLLHLYQLVNPRAMRQRIQEQLDLLFSTLDQKGG